VSGRVHNALAALFGPPPGTQAPPPAVPTVTAPAPQNRPWYTRGFVIGAGVVLVLCGAAGGVGLLLTSGQAPKTATNAGGIQQTAIGNAGLAPRQPPQPAAPAPAPAAAAAATPPPAKGRKLSDDAYGKGWATYGRDTRQGAQGSPGEAPAPAGGPAPAPAATLASAQPPRENIRPSTVQGRSATRIRSPHLRLRPGTTIPCVMLSATDTGSGDVSGLCLVWAAQTLSMAGTVDLLPMGTQVTIRATRLPQNGENRLQLTAVHAFPNIQGTDYQIDLLASVGDGLGRSGVVGEFVSNDGKRFWNAITLGLAGEGARTAAALAMQQAVPGGTALQSAAPAGMSGMRWSTNIPPTIRLAEGAVVVLQLNDFADFSNEIELAVIR
jgi:type IV secretory pathway VirB10-like protein